MKSDPAEMNRDKAEKPCFFFNLPEKMPEWESIFGIPNIV
jgi:hypothetical protein